MTGVEITGGAWLLVCLCGAVLGLDGTSWPQAMWSRPIVAGTIGGLLFGAPGPGFLAGAWLEIVSSRHPPYGAARYPETGPATLIAGAAYALSDTRSLGALLAAVWVGWTLGWVGMHSIAWMRRINVRLVGDPDALPGGPDDLPARHRGAMRIDALRAAAITAALFIPSVLVVRLVEAFEPGPGAAMVATALAIAALAGLAGIGIRSLGVRRDRWFALMAGLGIGLLLLRWLP